MTTYNKVEMFTGQNLERLIDDATTNLPDNLFITDMEVSQFGVEWVLKVFVSESHSYENAVF